MPPVEPSDPLRERTHADDAPRAIGRWGALAIVMGSMLGIGIFLTPRIVAEHIHAPLPFFALWAAGGLIALSGAVAYAELGAMFPRAGGDYVFLRHAWGDAVARASGWLLFGGIFVGSIATVAVPIFAYQAPALLAPFATLDPHAHVVAGLDAAQLGALVLVALLTGVNLLGTRTATGTQLVLTGLPTLALAAGAFWAFASGPHPGAIPPAPWDGGPPIGGTITALLAIYFAYSGWNAIGYVGGEVQEPERNIPRGLLGGTLAITAFYLLLAAAFVHVLGLGGVASSPEAGTATAIALGGSSLGWGMNLLITLALLGSLNGTILAGARIARAMACDGVLPSAVARLHRSRSTPAVALLLQAGLAGLLIVTGTFERLIEFTSLAMLLLGTLTVAGFFRLRRTAPHRPRPWRAFGVPWLPGIYLVTSSAILVISIWQAFTGDAPAAERYFPIAGLGAFVLAWVAIRLVTPHPLRAPHDAPSPPEPTC